MVFVGSLLECPCTPATVGGALERQSHRDQPALKNIHRLVPLVEREAGLQTVVFNLFLIF